MAFKPYCDVCNTWHTGSEPHRRVSEESTQISDCEVCGGDCAAANPPVMNCPLQSPPVKPAKSFWCVVALDYDNDEAWILDQSQDARDCDLLDGSSGDDNGLLQGWVKNACPGLYKLYLSPWGFGPDVNGEWDTGVDVSIAELLVAFPPRYRAPCTYCGPGKSTGLPGNACDNCMNTGLANPTPEDL